MKNVLVKCVLIFAFIFTSCTTNKKTNSDDEFAVEGDAIVDSEEIATSPGEDLTLGGLDEQPAAVDKGKAESTENNLEASLENELNSLGDTTAQQRAEKPDNELSLDEPVKGELSLDDATAQPSVAKTEVQAPEPPKQVEITNEAPPPAVISEEAPPPVVISEEPPSPQLPAVVESRKSATIDNVIYQANSNGGTVAIAANQPLKFTTRLNSTTNQFIVEVENSTIPKKLKRSLNTKDMASTIGSVDIYQKAGSNIVRFVVQLRQGSPEPIVQPEGNSLLIIGSGTAMARAGIPAEATSGATAALEVTETMGAAADNAPAASQNLGKVSIDGKPLPQPSDEIVDLATPGIMSSDDLEQFLISNNKFYGTKISIETGNMDMKDFLSFISEESGVNIIIDESVSGKISLKLRNIPWDQALILVLKSKKLGFKRQGSVLRIGRVEDFMGEEQAAVELKDARKARAPFVVKRFFIGYAEIKDLEAKIKAYLQALANVQTSGVANAAPPLGLGQTAVQQSPAATARTKEPVGTVLGDARTNSLIVTDTEENMEKISKLIQAIDIQPQQVLIEGKVVEAKESFTKGLGITWNSQPNAASSTNTSKIGMNPAIDAGSTVLDADFSWGSLDIFGSLTAKIQLGEREDKVRVLSSPRIAVLSSEQATIKQTSSVLIPKSTIANGATTVTQEAVVFGITLNVTPHVSNEGTVTLALDINRSFLPRVDSQAPDERSAKTKIIVKSGQTAVIGGIFESENREGASGVTGMKDIPILGQLFRSNSEAKSKNEMVIFVTPTILKPVVGSKKSETNSVF